MSVNVDYTNKKAFLIS